MAYNDEVPKEAIGALSGIYYKIGVHGRAYYWVNDEWLKSEKHPDIVVSDIGKKRNKFSLDT